MEVIIFLQLLKYVYHNFCASTENFPIFIVRRCATRNITFYIFQRIVASRVPEKICYLVSEKRRYLKNLNFILNPEILFKFLLVLKLSVPASKCALCKCKKRHHDIGFRS
jgi:hypothetical protein